MANNAFDITNELIDLSNELGTIYSSYLKSEDKSGIEELEKIKKFFGSINKNIDDQVLKIAVVGAIKSGKSTFINSFLKSDFLKRGAGVITSVVTRVMAGKEKKAVVSFKTIDEINNDIKNSVVLLPEFEDNGNFDDFDIRDINSRQRLDRVLVALKNEDLFTKDSREAKSVYLQSYLKGYERLENILEKGEFEFFGDNFDEYKDFASQEPLAVYVKDIYVEIPGNAIDEKTEIADCQGSDSTNPLHIARIQDYLLKTNFIIYLVSTRTGLRQADIIFLNMLKKMGLTGQSVFVLNADLSEHENLEDLKRVEKKTAEEICLLKPDAKYFTISALYELFTENEDSLSKKDILRLEQWRLDKESSIFLKNGFKDFNNYFKNELILKKQFFFYSSILGKIRDKINELSERLEIKIKILDSGDKTAEKELIDQTKKFREVKNIIKNTMEGSKSKFDKNLKNEIDSFFSSSSEITGMVYDFIKSYKGELNKYVVKTGDSSVKVNYFSLYQDFRQSLDNFVTREINPLVISFIKEKEKEIVSYYYELSKSSEYMVFETRNNFQKTIGKDPVKFGTNIPSPDNFSLEQAFEIPSALDALNYNVVLRSSAMAGSSMVFFKNLINRIFKPKNSLNDDALKIIEKGLLKIKKETESTLKNHFLNYRENLKFQYVLKFSEQVMDVYLKSLIESLDSYVNDFSDILEIMENNQESKKVCLEELGRLESQCGDLSKRAEEITKRLDL
ncbi:MAG: dynamin family protein [Desulfobacteraceae bacterium]|nr:dynamin family protein [Desulfobacteraceae bacterium]